MAIMRSIEDAFPSKVPINGCTKAASEQDVYICVLGSVEDEPRAFNPNNSLSDLTQEEAHSEEERGKKMRLELSEVCKLSSFHTSTADQLRSLR